MYRTKALGGYLLLAAIFWMVFILFVLPQIAKRKAHDVIHQLPEIKAKAKVIAKSMGNASQYEGVYRLIQVFNVTFELESKERLHFHVNEEQYHTILEDEEGILVYKMNGPNRVFHRFEHGE